MISETELRTKAQESCLEHARREISGELLVELLDSDLEWDPIILRHIFDQPMVVWRRFGEFEIVTDEEGCPVGFLDSSHKVDCKWMQLSRDEALLLAMQTGWLSSATEAVSEIKQVAGGAGRLEVRDTLRPVGEDRFKITLNPVTKKVISILPSDYESDD